MIEIISIVMVVLSPAIGAVLGALAYFFIAKPKIGFLRRRFSRCKIRSQGGCHCFDAKDCGAKR